MVKALLIVTIVLLLALAAYTSIGDAQVTTSWGACLTVIDRSNANASRFCEALQSGHVLWTIVLVASLLAAALVALALYFGFIRKP